MPYESAKTAEAVLQPHKQAAKGVLWNEYIYSLFYYYKFRTVKISKKTNYFLLLYSMSKVVIGLSGGVDSSVAAYLLKEQGHSLTALFMINWHERTGTVTSKCTWEEDALIAEMVAKKLDIPFQIVDLSKEYKQRVIDYMFSEYEAGQTPNPDVLCNREIKFDTFMNEALKLGADYVATGHYCRKETTIINGQPVHHLLAGKDINKDQSYFLCQLNQEQLAKSLFPVGHLTKPEVREIAREQNLPTAERKESQGI